MSTSSKKQMGLLAVLIVAVVALASLYTYDKKKYRDLSSEKSALETALATSEESTRSLRAAVETMNGTITRLTEDKQALDSLLTAEQRRSDAYKNQLGEVTNTVDTLTKLTQTDKELLQKYSRVYFLSENYVPSALTPIDTKYLYQKDKPLEIHDRVWPSLRRMLDTAAMDGIVIQIISAYRSFGTQEVLKSNYKFTYGAGTANQFSADQGYSEHQLGTTLDFTTPAVGANFEKFESTSAYTWLKSHAHLYGFILSYPKSNAFFQFEPWHWRFVGIDLATKIHIDGKNFYDYDQREIDKYLVNIFNLPM